MIRIAVMTFMFGPRIGKGELSHADLVALCAAAGAKGLEAFHTDFVRSPALADEYRRLLDDHGMCMPVMDVMTNLVYADDRQRQQGLDALLRGLDICAELDVGIAHVAGHKPVDGVTLEDARNMIADTLAAHAGAAAARGITLAFEDFDPSPTLVCAAADCLHILRRAGGKLRFVFDTGNFSAVRERADENFDALYPHTCHFHFKDYAVASDGARRGCPLGQGDMPNAAVARALLARGYDGWVALEALSGLPPAQAIPSDMATLKRWLELD